MVLYIKSLMVKQTLVEKNVMLRFLKVCQQPIYYCDFQAQTHFTPKSDNCKSQIPIIHAIYRVLADCKEKSYSVGD